MSSENNIFELRRTINAQQHSVSLESLAREHTKAALNTIIAIMNAPTTSDRDKLTAAFGLLDRGWGRPTQTLVNAGDDNDSRA
jgi:hypothetical protein